MSGIAAVFNADGAPADKASLDAMMRAMSFRGPDGIDMAILGEAALGFLAFHTHAHDPELAQPLASRDGRFAIVFDGYLINHTELRDDLVQRGAALRSGSDAELALEGFAYWGKNFAERLEGEFALVIWDACEHRLTCIRDHHGMRPLTWHWDGGRLLVASDIAAIIAALDEPPQPNIGYIAEHLASEWYTHDETPWLGVMKLPGAHVLELEKGQAQPRISQYWSVPHEVTIRYRRDEDYAEHYLEMFDRVVRRAARSDRPVGFEVSGGLDSSSVFCLADRAIKAGRLDAPDIKGFGLRGPAGDQSDEISYIRAVANHTGRPIAEVELFQPGLDWFIRQGINDATLPFPPNTVMLARLQEEVSASGCRISLSGQGGDQWLDGVAQHYRETLAAHNWRALAASLAAHRQDAGAAQAARQFWLYGIKPLIPELVKKPVRALRHRKPTSYERDDWLVPELREILHEKRRSYEARMAEVPRESRYKLQKWEFPFTTLVNEMMNLQAARRQMEYRHPMLSRPFIEFSTQTPEHIRRRGNTRRFVHRFAMKGILPEAVRTRPDDATFNSPFYSLYDEIERYSLSKNSEQFLADHLVKGALDSVFVKNSGRGMEAVPMWDLWVIFASAAFINAASSQAKNAAGNP